MLNGDILVENLADVLPDMMRYADHFTCYNDISDVATAASTAVQCLIPRSLQSWRRPGINSITQTWGRVVSPIWISGSPGGLELVGLEIEAYLPDRRGSASQYVPATGFEHCIDVIDCTSLDYNATFARHNYYAISALMVEDMCELIADCRSAKDRAHLVRQRGNVFDFLTAPKEVSQ